jgi:hypothetical protein
MCGLAPVCGAAVCAVLVVSTPPVTAQVWPFVDAEGAGGFLSFSIGGM